MNNLSLVKITLGVAFATVATFIVNANDIAPRITEVKNTVAAESVSLTEKQDFLKLLSELDADKNGALSETELSTSNDESLKIAFKLLDSNQDSNISADEFSSYKSEQMN